METNKTVFKKPVIIAIIAFQLLIISGMIAKSVYPLYTGKPVRLRVQAYDPRDIFRGNYSELNYDFSTIFLDSLKNDFKTERERYTFGDEIFIELAQVNGVFKPVGAWTNAPEGKTFLKAIVVQDFERSMMVKAGIETFYASPEKARELDRIIAAGRADTTIQVFANVMIAPGGEARIKSLEYK